MIVALLFALTLILVSSMDIYVPIGPELAAHFAVDGSFIKYTFLLGPFASLFVGIFAGFLSDRYGRRPVVLVGLLLYCLGTLICCLAPSFTFFFGGRVLQSLAVGGLLVINAAILADQYRGISLARTLGLYALLFPLAFCLSPIIGAYIYNLFGWQWVFGSLLAAALPISLLLFWLLPESCSGQNESSFFSELAQFRAISLALIHALPMTIGMLFTINGAFLYQAAYGFDAAAFSFVQAIPVAFQCMGALAYRQVVAYIGLGAALKVGFFVAFCFSVLSFFTILNCVEGPWLFVATVSAFTLGASFLTTTGQTLLFDQYLESKGFASSLLSFARNLALFVVAAGASLLSHHSAIPTLSAMLVVSVVICLLIASLLQPKIKERSCLTNATNHNTLNKKKQ